MDVTGPHPKSRDGYTLILTVADHFSKWLGAYPMKNQEAATIVDILVKNVLTVFGMPKQILSDNGTNFQSMLFKELCNKMKIDKLSTTIFKSSTNGLSERSHRSINSMLAKIIDDNQKNWAELLPFVTSAYRSSQHSVTRYTPNFLVYGREARMPIDLVLGTPGDPSNRLSVDEHVAQMQNKMMIAYEAVRKNLKVAAECRKNYYDMRVKKENFVEGNRVWYYYPRRFTGKSVKWQKTYVGPFQILKKLGPLNYLIKAERGGRLINAHVDKLKMCLSMEETFPATRENLLPHSGNGAR